MDTHSTIFVPIDKLVSPPRLSFAGQVKGQTGAPPPNKRSVLSRLLKPGVCCLARVTYETRFLLIGGRQLAALRTAWVTLVFAGPATGSSLSSFSALTQSST